jgi:4-diphosphocytidyl-2-C-methyl-D-erythritol kinase
VYRAFDELGGARHAAELGALEAAVRTAAPPAVNDLQPAALRLCPAIAPALEAVRAAGAAHAMVSGSGPTVYGLVPDQGAAERAAGELRAAGYPRALAAAPVGPQYAAVRRLPASQ